MNTIFVRSGTISRRGKAQLNYYVRGRISGYRICCIDPSPSETGLYWKVSHDFESGLARTIDWYLDHRAWWEHVRAARYAGQRLGTPGSAGPGHGAANQGKAA